MSVLNVLKIIILMLITYNVRKVSILKTVMKCLIIIDVKNANEI